MFYVGIMKNIYFVKSLVHYYSFPFKIVLIAFINLDWIWKILQVFDRVSAR